MLLFRKIFELEGYGEGHMNTRQVEIVEYSIFKIVEYSIFKILTVKTMSYVDKN